MLILAIDTATPATTVAVTDGTAALASSTAVDARRHGEMLAPAVHSVLREAGIAPGDVTDIAVGVGPGPYTGLRVGVVTARTFGAVLGTRVHGLCTLDVLAYECRLDEPFVVATDARRKEVYWARYDNCERRATEPAVSKPADLTGMDKSEGGPSDVPAELPAIGQGALLYPEVFPAQRPPTYPSAAVLGQLAADRLDRGESFLPPEPLYLRRPHAAAPGPRKRVSPS